MAEKHFDDSDIRQAILQARRRLSQRTVAEREEIIQEAINQALTAELNEERAASERTTQALKQALLDPREEAARARQDALSRVVVLVVILLMLLFLAAVTGRSNIIHAPGVDESAPLPSRFDSPTAAPSSLRGQGLTAIGSGDPRADAAALGGRPPASYSVGETFRDFYDRNGGARIFGLPISEPLQVNGRMVQWFERARLEEWPEYSGTAYAVQSGRVGVEFTTGLNFPKQIFFVSRPGLRFFPETGHAVRGSFLQFWEQNGGLMVFGFPISDEVQERLPDGATRTVQYFERARLELHADQGGGVQLGLLGRGLYLRESRPAIIAQLQPTAVPMP
jgi:hypothetical protein